MLTIQIIFEKNIYNVENRNKNNERDRSSNLKLWKSIFLLFHQIFIYPNIEINGSISASELAAISETKQNLWIAPPKKIKIEKTNLIKKR